MKLTLLTADISQVDEYGMGWSRLLYDRILFGRQPRGSDGIPNFIGRVWAEVD